MAEGYSQEEYDRIMGGKKGPTPRVQTTFDPDKTLLLHKKQVILFGPPGTGKTYATKKLALNIINQED